MNLPPVTTVHLPRVLLEHALPLDGDGISASLPLNSPPGSTLHFGGLDRWQRTPAQPCPGFTLDRLMVLAALISLTERRNGATLSFNQLFRAITGSQSCCSAHHRESLKSSLCALESIDLALDLPSAPSRYERLLSITPTHSRPVFGQPAPAFIVHFSPLFLSLYADPAACAPLDLFTLRSLRSRLARVLYIQLSTWAAYSRATAHKPFRITFSRLIEHLGNPVPAYRSQRRSFFFGHRARSLFDEILSAPTPYGQLCLKITSASSVDDDCLLVWHSDTAEGSISLPARTAQRSLAATSSPSIAFTHSSPESAPSFSSSAPPTLFASAIQTKVSPAPAIVKDPLSSFRHLKIFQAWNASGRSETEFLSRVRTHATLSQPDLEALHAARVPLHSCENFLTLSKKLLSDRTWQDLLGEAKYAALAAAAPSNPAGKLISEILSAIRAQV